MQNHGIQLSDQEKEEKIHGKHNPAILSGLFKRDLSPEEIGKFSMEKEKIYQNLCQDLDLELASGAIDLFHCLQEKGIPITIATASDLINVDFYFSEFNLSEFFDQNKVVT